VVLPKNMGEASTTNDQEAVRKTRKGEKDRKVAWEEKLSALGGKTTR